jgi:hypothetical protein
MATAPGDAPRFRVEIRATGRSMRIIEFQGETALAEATAFFDDMKKQADVYELSLAKFVGDDWRDVTPAIRRGRRGKWEVAM